MNKERICIIGGDMRYVFLYNLLCNQNFHTCSCGINTMQSMKKQETAEYILSEVSGSNTIILPSPVTLNLQDLNAPLCSFSVPLNSLFAEKCIGKTVFCGFSSRLMEISDTWKKVNIKDYSLEENLLIKNAFLTAKGAIKVCSNHMNKAPDKCKILVCGFGRIGKALAFMLKDIGSDVYVSARKETDISWIDGFGFKSLRTDNISKTNVCFDIILNTIPHIVFDEHTLKELCGEPIIVDIASAPGGIDFSYCKKHNIKAYKAPALPGKFFPDESAQIIKDAILRLM